MPTGGPHPLCHPSSSIRLSVSRSGVQVILRSLAPLDYPGTHKHMHWHRYLHHRVQRAPCKHAVRPSALCHTPHLHRRDSPRDFDRCPHYCNYRERREHDNMRPIELCSFIIMVSSAFNPRPDRSHGKVNSALLFPHQMLSLCRITACPVQETPPGCLAPMNAHENPAPMRHRTDNVRKNKEKQL